MKLGDVVKINTADHPDNDKEVRIVRFDDLRNWACVVVTDEFETRLVWIPKTKLVPKKDKVRTVWVHRHTSERLEIQTDVDKGTDNIAHVCDLRQANTNLYHYDLVACFRTHT